MGFADSISKLKTRSMPLSALLSYELRGLWKSWLVRSWLIATAVVTFMIVAINWGRTPTAPLVAQVLFPYLVFPWFMVVLLLSLNPVTGSRLDALSDGILCRPINRWEYLLSSWFARVVVVVVAFIVVIVPAVLVVVAADRPVVAEDSVTGYGVTASIAVVMLVLTFLTSLGFFAGTLLKSPLFAAAVLILFWIPVNMVLHTFSLEEFSPISLNQSLPTLLRTAWSEHDATKTDDMANMRAAVDQATDFLSTLTGQSTSKPQTSPEFYERGDYADFSLTRVFLGYGTPTLVCLGLTTVIFCRRDL